MKICDYFGDCWEAHEQAVAEGDQEKIAHLHAEHDRIVRAAEAGEEEIVPAVRCVHCGDYYVPDKEFYSRHVEDSDRECPSCRAAMEEYDAQVVEETHIPGGKMKGECMLCGDEFELSAAQEARVASGQSYGEDMECPGCKAAMDEYDARVVEQMLDDLERIYNIDPATLPEEAFDPETGEVVTSIHEFTVDAVEERRL